MNRRLIGFASATVPALALAATAVTFGSSFKDVPTIAWMLTLVLSTLAGIGSLLNRVREELRQHGALPRMAIFAASHMVGSWIAGGLVFLLGVGAGLSDWYLGASIILASYMGAVFIERLAVKWLSHRLGVDLTKPMPLDPLPAERRHSPVDRRVEPPPPHPKRRDQDSDRAPSDFTPLSDS